MDRQALLESQKKIEAKAEEDYRKLVKQIAIGKGKAPTAERIFEVRQAAGKTADELADDVEKVELRHRLQTEIKELESEIEAEEPKLEAELRELNEAFEKLEAEHVAKVQPINAELNRLNLNKQQASNLRQQLRRTISDEVRERQRELRKQIDALDEPIKRYRKMLEQAEAKLRYYQENRHNANVHPDKLAQSFMTEEEIERQRKHVEELKAKQQALIEESKRLHNDAMYGDL